MEEWVEQEFLRRSSHALLADDGAWLVDPVDNGRVDELRNVAGVIQLLDRHHRDCAVIAARLAVPHHVVPVGPVGPFEFLPVRQTRRWHEVALWWPQERVLVCGDALGTVGYFRLAGERLGVHPLLRLRPPQLDVNPDVVLCGHGPGVFDEANAAFEEALTTARQPIPRQLLGIVRRRRPQP